MTSRALRHVCHICGLYSLADELGCDRNADRRLAPAAIHHAHSLAVGKSPRAPDRITAKPRRAGGMVTSTVDVIAGDRGAVDQRKIHGVRHRPIVVGQDAAAVRRMGAGGVQVGPPTSQPDRYMHRQ